MKYLSDAPFTANGVTNDAYRTGWERIFGKREIPEPPKCVGEACDSKTPCVACSCTPSCCDCP